MRPTDALWAKLEELEQRQYEEPHNFRHTAALLALRLLERVAVAVDKLVLLNRALVAEAELEAAVLFEFGDIEVCRDDDEGRERWRVDGTEVGAFHGYFAKRGEAMARVRELLAGTESPR